MVTQLHREPVGSDVLGDVFSDGAEGSGGLHHEAQSFGLVKLGSLDLDEHATGPKLSELSKAGRRQIVRQMDVRWTVNDAVKCLKTACIK